MYKSQKPGRIAARMSAVAVLIGAAFLTLTVAGASAANVSLIETLKGWVGLGTAVASVNENRPLNTTPQTLPFSQDWSNVGLISVDDDWSSVPGIVGYRGDDLNTTIGADLQTILIDGSGTPLDVNANRSDPDVFTSGGICEFDGIANPAVAFQGSGTADVPHLVIHLNTTGQSNIRLTYNARDIDGASDVIQQLNTQFRVGATGDYTNLTGGYFADASATGATQVTPVSVTLPAAANNQPLVMIRIMTINAVGSDEFLGIDDITVTSGSSTPTNTATGSPTPTNTGTPTNTATPTPTSTGSPVTTPTPPQSPTIVLSQVYGGGGNTGATLINDYIELHNVTNQTISIEGWSVQYSAPTSTTPWSAANTTVLTGSIPAGGYYLVQEAAGTGGTQALPTPDAIGTVAMGGTNGRVALVNHSVPLTEPCPSAAFVVDFIGYGTANCFEGPAAAPAASNTTAEIRGNLGCLDTNNNSTDFTVDVPNPRNSSSPRSTCAGGPSPTNTNTGTPTNTPTRTPTSTPTFTATATATATSTATATNTQTATPSGSPTATPACTTSTNLVGSQEVPPTNSTGTGIGTVSLSADHTQITINLSFSGLSSNAVAAHIHGPAAAGTNAGILFGLAGVPSATTGAIPTQTVNVTPTQVAQLRAGLFYFNVHSVNFSGGEIRGQILPTCAAVRGDFDGDGKSDVSVFRPSEGNWYQNRSISGFTATNWGLGTDTLVPGDYDGDGKTDVAIYRGDSSNANPDFYVLNSSTNTISYAFWGNDTDLPLSGDYNGDGKTDFSVYRPSTNVWYIQESGSGNIQSLYFGTGGDLPLFMDSDGDGKSNLAMFRPSNGTWYIARSTGAPSLNFDAVQFGINGDIPVPADFDGDHKDDVAVFRPSNGTWYGIFSSTGGFASEQFGLNGDIPVPADYDGDSKADVAVFRNGIWYFDLTDSGFSGYQFGLSTDIPIQRRYHP